MDVAVVNIGLPDEAPTRLILLGWVATVNTSVVTYECAWEVAPSEERYRLSIESDTSTSAEFLYRRG